MRTECNYYSKVPVRSKEYWLLSPITQSTRALDNTDRLALWYILMGNRDKLVTRVLNHGS